MVVDTSAVAAILFEEPEGRAFARLIAGNEVTFISVVAVLELTIVAANRATPDPERAIRAAFDALEIEPVAVDLEQGAIAREAFLRFGRGRHPAGLSFGDCFSYALARSRGLPLLFKGDDFARTDIVPAWPA